MQVLNCKEIQFDGIVGNSLGKVGDKINQGDFRGREERGGRGHNSLHEAEGNKVLFTYIISSIGGRGMCSSKVVVDRGC